MRRLISAAAAVFLLAAPVSADYLQSADEAYARAEASADEDGMAAARELRDYVLQSGAVKDAGAETRRLYMWNYMLNLEKQSYDYEQRFNTELYAQSGQDERLAYLTETAYENARRANEIQSELNRNEAYLEKLTEDESVLAHADRLEEGLAGEEAPEAGIAADVILIAGAAVLIGVLLRLFKGFCKKRGYGRPL